MLPCHWSSDDVTTQNFRKVNQAWTHKKPFLNCSEFHLMCKRRLLARHCCIHVHHILAYKATQKKKHKFNSYNSKHVVFRSENIDWLTRNHNVLEWSEMSTSGLLLEYTYIIHTMMCSLYWFVKEVYYHYFTQKYVTWLQM